MTSIPHPVRVEALADFMHPDREHVFGQAFRWGRDHGVANGYLALRVETVLDCDRESPAAVARIEALPWEDSGPKMLRDPEWKAMEERAPGLRNAGETRYWAKMPGEAGEWYRRTLRRVNIRRHQVCLAEAQLIARLPRAEVCLDSPHGWLRFRFRGGVGLLRAFSGKLVRACDYTLWRAKNQSELF